MPPGDEYKRHAAECLRLASLLSDTENRAALLGMAQAWSRLAEQAVKNSQTDVVYEVPPRRDPRS
jgi:hypothetical protein